MAHRPTLALPPLSPERAPHSLPRGTSTDGPARDAPAGVAGFWRRLGLPEAATAHVCGMSRHVPSGRWTCWVTTSAGTRAGQYRPKALAGVGGVVVWNPA